MNFMSAAGRSGFYEEITSSSSTSSFHHHRRPEEEEESDEVVQREHMFDKVVTPSDVGKLNRLVIPKQHAEKYFPLDSSTNEKGLLLNFEDRNGKPWRFRYSYWNSSQSYVMTKGWSRFVKEKKLDAGDIVTFQRGVGELAKDRLFIDWRRRPDAPELPISMPHHQFSSFHRSIHPWSPLYNIQPQQQYHIPSSYNYNYNYNPCHPPPPPPPPLGGSIVYLRGGPPGGAGGGPAQRVFDSVPVVQGKATAKRLRLFGVNMDCPIEECDILSSSTVPTMPLHHRPDSSSSSRTNYSTTVTDDPAADYNNNKGKGSMSLDLDI